MAALVEWEYFNKFRDLNKKYMPDWGEGNTRASQIVTATANIVYGYYNNGDIFDTKYFLEGGFNDISSYANWLNTYVPESSQILHTISECRNYGDYENLLKNLADLLMNENYLAEQNKIDKIGSIYGCNGIFKFEF
jgi:hypothetical protein